jgi:hypothetical protein
MNSKIKVNKTVILLDPRGVITSGGMNVYVVESAKNLLKLMIS